MHTSWHNKWRQDENIDMAISWHNTHRLGNVSTVISYAAAVLQINDTPMWTRQIAVHSQNRFRWDSEPRSDFLFVTRHVTLLSASCDLVHCREMQIIMQNCLICHLANIHHGLMAAKVSKVHVAWVDRAWLSQVSDVERSDLNTLQWAACSCGRGRRGRHALFKDLVVLT